MAVRGFKKRYVLFEIVRGNLSYADFCNSLRKAALSFMGEFNYSQAHIKVLKEFYVNSRGVIEVDNKFLNEVKVSLSLIKEAVVVSKKVYGTLKKIKKEGI